MRGEAAEIECMCPSWNKVQMMGPKVLRGVLRREKCLFELPLSVDILSPRGRLEIEFEDVCDSMRVS